MVQLRYASAGNAAGSRRGQSVRLCLSFARGTEIAEGRRRDELWEPEFRTTV